MGKRNLIIVIFCFFTFISFAQKLVDLNNPFTLINVVEGDYYQDINNRNIYIGKSDGFLKLVGNISSFQSSNNSVETTSDLNRDIGSFNPWQVSGTNQVAISATQDIFTSGTVVVGNSLIESSALLQIQSNSKGFLPPRLTSFQIRNITNPEEGLLVYNLDIACLSIYANSKWRNLCGS